MAKKKKTAATTSSVRPNLPTHDEQWIAAWLARYGHFSNQKHNEARNVSVEDGEHLKLTQKDSEFREAVESIQKLDINIEEFVQQIHGPNRAVQFDGDVGPATIALMNLPRCGRPDYGESVVDAMPGEEPDGLDLFSKDAPSVMHAGGGSGGWLNCHPDHEDAEFHSIRIRIETDRMPAGFRAYLMDVLNDAQICCSEIGLYVDFHVDPSEPRSAFEIYQYWVPIPGGTIGINQLPQGNTCRQTLWGKMDTGYVPTSFHQAARLQIHEAEGHGIGLGHYRGGLLNPSILNKPGSRPSYIGDPAYPRLKKMYGGEQIVIPGGPTDPNLPPGPISTLPGELWTEPNQFGGISIRGNISPEGNYDGSAYIAVPKHGEPGKYIFTRRIQV